MKKATIILLTFASLTLVATTIDAKQRASESMGAVAAPEPIDPKKKKAGEACTKSEECQRHHECKKHGDQGVCTAPPPVKMPPGVVT